MNKKRFICEGGPIAGYPLYLSIGSPVTMVFRYDGQRGYYKCEMEYGAFTGRKLKWVSV